MDFNFFHSWNGGRSTVSFIEHLLVLPKMLIDISKSFWSALILKCAAAARQLLPLLWLEQEFHGGAGRASGTTAVLTWLPECPGDTAQLMCAWGKHGYRTGSKKVSPLPPSLVSWFGVVFNSVLKQHRGHKRQAGPWRGKTGLGQADWGCGSPFLFWKDGSCGWGGEMWWLCEDKGVGLPRMSQFHQNIVWVKNWPNPIDLVSFVYSIPISGKTPRVLREESVVRGRTA